MMDLEDVIPVDCCRLVKYDEFHDYLERSYEGEEDTPMGLLLGGVKSTYMFDLLLETRKPDQVFQSYKPGGKQLYIPFSCTELKIFVRKCFINRNK
jgi:ubiquitin carboxyl-terminal hydrolase 47